MALTHHPNNTCGSIQARPMETRRVTCWSQSTSSHLPRLRVYRVDLIDVVTVAKTFHDDTFTLRASHQIERALVVETRSPKSLHNTCVLFTSSPAMHQEYCIWPKRRCVCNVQVRKTRTSTTKEWYQSSNKHTHNLNSLFRVAGLNRDVAWFA